MDNGEDGDEDAHLWAHIVQDITPIDGNKPRFGGEVTQGQGKASAPKKGQVRRVDKSAPEHACDGGGAAKQGREMDRRSAQRFARGKMPIEGRLDLHGMNQGQAREALIAFVEAAYRAGKRKVLVITGKGRTKSPDAAAYGVLRARVPEWLGEAVIAPMVLRVSEAQPEHGGGGALYVLLRRDR